MILGRRNVKKTCLSILLAVVCFMTSLLFIGINAKAYSVVKTGTITANSGLNIRKDAGTGYDIIFAAYFGEQGTVTDEKTAADGSLWYKITINGVTGWGHSNYIAISTIIVGTDGDFESYLTAQGFPESYKVHLRTLHSKYPNWIFQAQHTTMTWEQAIAGEYALGKCLSHSTAPTSWKSTQNGAYDWTTGTWKVFDTGGWVAASKEVIEHFMDPRNSMGESSIFQFLRQSYNASEYDAAGLEQVKNGLKTMVTGTYLTGMCDDRPYVDVIMEVAADKGVSPYVLASMMIQEIGVDGISGSISGTVPGYEGYYNYFNVNAYATDTLTAVQKGLQYAMGSGSLGRPWNTRYKSIAGGAQNYAVGFIAKGQDTMYLKKFNVQGSYPYTNQYMTNVQGAYSEGLHMAKAYDETARQGSLVFKIPVFRNMPENACPKPTSNENPNYMLNSLSVSGYTLTPTFSMHETSYSLIVGNEVSSVNVDASAVAGTTSVAGKGTHNLNVGTNTIHVTTTAGNGAQRTYTITIVRQAPVTPAPEPEQPEVTVPTPDINSSSVSVNKGDNTITGITEHPISVDSFKAKFSVENGNIKVVTANGTEKSGTNSVGTGDQIRVYDNSGVHKYTYNVTIYGDTNGDGQVTAMDLLRVQKDILSINKLSGFYSKAADTNKDGNVNGLDLLQVKKHILQMKAISQ